MRSTPGAPPSRRWWGRASDQIGLAFDNGRLRIVEPSGWNSIEADDLLLAAGEPLPTRAHWIPHGQDGEQWFLFEWLPEGVQERWPAAVRVQYMHMPKGVGVLPRQGWVRAMTVTLPAPVSR